MTDLGPFPELVEARRLDLDQINGVDPARLTIGAEGRCRHHLPGRGGGVADVLGVYLIDPDGTIRDPRIVLPAVS